MASLVTYSVARCKISHGLRNWERLAGDEDHWWVWGGEKSKKVSFPIGCAQIGVKLAPFARLWRRIIRVQCFEMSITSEYAIMLFTISGQEMNLKVFSSSFAKTVMAIYQWRTHGAETASNKSGEHKDLVGAGTSLWNENNSILVPVFSAMYYCQSATNLNSL